MAPLLSIQDLIIETDKSVSRHGIAKTIVDKVSLTLKRGEVLGLIGESGAGKTSIGLAAMGYGRAGVKLTGGVIDFDGSDLRQMSSDQLRDLRGKRIAYIAQSAAASFNPALRLGRQVNEVAVRSGRKTWAQAAIDSAKAFADLNLPDPELFGSRFPHQVSGGQLQRAMSAMAMACGPDILVLDEPTTALDVTTQIEVLASLRQLIRSHGTAALYISHDLALVAQIADRIMVLRNGKLVEEGPTKKIITDPFDPYTRKLVAVRAADSTLPFLSATPTDDSAPLLSIKNVGASYRTRKNVITGVSVDLHKGETVSVIGESGSGKTSLARAICGLLPIDNGEISFGGSKLPPRLEDRGKDALHRIQLVYQMPDVALNPRHTIGKIIARPIRLFNGENKAAARQLVIDLLRMVELPEDMIDRYPRQLSGGQKQRVCIARALAADPDVMICDEVTSGLDPLVAEEILKLLKRIQEQRGLALLFITHDLGLVRRTSERVMVMFKGEVLAQGAVEDVFEHPEHPYTRQLLASVPEMRTGWLDEILDARAEHKSTAPAETPKLVMAR